jgi:hypothetical protein
MNSTDAKTPSANEDQQPATTDGEGAVKAKQPVENHHMELHSIDVPQPQLDSQ